MAVNTAPLLSFGASGQIAKTMVMAKWRGRPYTRRYVIPANPNSSGQQVTRNLFAWGNNVWKLGPSLFQAPWTAFASGQVFYNRNAFLSKLIKGIRGLGDNTDMIFSPGAKGGLATNSIIVTPSAGALNVAFTNPTPPTGWTLASAVAACITQQDPQSGTDYIMTAAEDTSTFDSVDLTGLTSSSLYVVGAWLKWTKPDGTTAYGPSINATGTPS